MQQQIDDLRAEVSDLRDRLNRDSSNSSVPPSADPPHAKPAPSRAPSGKRKGGQPGHPRAVRPLLPPDIIHHLKPKHCRRCRHHLGGTDPDPLVHQVHEIPAVRPSVTEYRRHRLACSHCAAVTCAELPVGVASGYGPRAQAVCALLSGACRLGKRMVSQICNDLFGLSIGPAAACDLPYKTARALEPVVAGVHADLAGKPANVDETGWREGGKRAWLWVAVTAGVAAFVIRRSRARKVLGELIPGVPGVLTTDRYPVYDHFEADRRQVCRAHLRRDFQAMIDRGNDGRPIGEQLLAHADALLGLWKRVRDGTLTRRGFRSHHLIGLRAAIHVLLRRGRECRCAKTAGVCRELLALGSALYTFADVEGVEPTNNAAERALRHAVCWRKTSYGTDSDRGSRFVERVLTVLASCRQQGRSVLAFFTDAILAARNGMPAPSLIKAPLATP
ncbi:MAG: IS66 family transposase [Planctomycetes bacterium]|nr:IS66 family transposase [Planctomycetota bacterium]